MNWICRTCGVEQAVAEQPPSECAICTDERQYVLPSGPAWTTSNELVDTGFGLRVDELERATTAANAPASGDGQAVQRSLTEAKSELRAQVSNLSNLSAQQAAPPVSAASF